MSMNPHSTFNINTMFSAPIPADPPAPSATQNFTYTGTAQTFTVPSNTYWIKVTARGAAGGTGVANTIGGSGGYLQGWVATTPQTQYTVVVAQGGFGKGPSATARYGGGGGGFSGLLDTNGAHVATAGGGGGTQTNAPIVSSGVATQQGGHSIVYGVISSLGGVGGIGNSTVSSDPLLTGTAGSSLGGGTGGSTMVVGVSVDAGGGGGGGGFGTTAGLGGAGSNGSVQTDGATGRGGDGGFGGGGGGGGGGFGGTIQRTLPGGGAGGGKIGGEGGKNSTTAPHCHGQGGWNYLQNQTNPRGGATVPLISTISGGGAVGVIGVGSNGNNGSVTVEW